MSRWKISFVLTWKINTVSFDFSYYTKGVEKVNSLLNRGNRFAKKHASTILTCLGGAGVVATSIMAVKATPKALLLIEEAEKEKGEDLTKLEVVKTAGPVYIPSIITGTATLACIFGANILNKRNQAALMSSYALLNDSYKRYREKTIELYGKDSDSNIKTEIAKDKYKENKVSVGEGKQLFYDRFSERYFEATMNDVIKAEYKTAAAMIVNSGTSVNTFYNALNLPNNKMYDEYGWAWSTNEEMYWIAWTEFKYEIVTLDDGTDCTFITMPFEPLVEYEYY